MAKDYAKSFYNSKAWIDCRNSYMSSKNYICERCKDSSYICHHKEHITESNIDDPMITLNWDNLQSLCLDCHNRIHGNNETTREGLVFDSEGNLVEN